jgi:hypothetical protein
MKSVSGRGARPAGSIHECDDGDIKRIDALQLLSVHKHPNIEVTPDTTLSGVDRTVTHPKKTPGEASYRCGSLSASYFHAYFPSCPGAIAAFQGGKGAHA